MTHLDTYLETNAEYLRLRPLLVALLHDAREALADLPRWERGFHIFWLLGPFILLVERTPSDLWLSLLALTFMVRSIIKREGSWLNPFWVKAGFAFWFWCIIAGAISYHPAYSMGEAFIWFRFPLFAAATTFWLARDKRLLYAMLLSTALGLVLMCFILTAEIMIVGQQDGRLTWPYGDLMPGNYVAKVGLPAFMVMVALAVSIKGRVAGLSSIIALSTIFVSVMTGERINFLIRACAGMLAGLVWKPRWGRYLGLVTVEILVVLAFISIVPQTTQSRFSEMLDDAQLSYQKDHFRVLMGGVEAYKTSPIVGIGPGNYRLLAPEILASSPQLRPNNHPHNYYIQLMAEVGVIGLVLGVVFLWAIIWTCFWASLRHRDNVFAAIAWVIPFGIFWPIATTADFFGQWNNIFIWSAVALALSVQGFLNARPINTVKER
jgi:hypothetical protein